MSNSESISSISYLSTEKTPREQLEELDRAEFDLRTKEAQRRYDAIRRELGLERTDVIQIVGNQIIRQSGWVGIPGWKEAK